ncbi:MAG: phytanoyl-CoA dioxygenase family protein [Rhodospirillaceae bacterium]|nr:phytanoyl-CoA dioxygenase family protein [Rhodospirillaceae bacterium]
MSNNPMTSVGRDAGRGGSIAEFRSRGFSIFEDVLSAQECGRLVEAGHALVEAGHGSFMPIMQPHRKDSLFMATLAHEKLLDIVEKLVGGDPAGLQTEFFFCKPGIPGFAEHQDNFYVRGEPDRFVSAWIALVDISPDMGGLFVYPESHRLNILPVRDTGLEPVGGQDLNAYARAVVMPGDFKGQPESLEVRAGSAVFLHGNLVHGSHRNVSEKFRYALLCTYIRAGSSFNPGNIAKRTEIPLKRPI